jgi:hypothetical protein
VERRPPWLIPATLGLFAFIFFLPKIIGLYQDGIVGTGIASAFLAVVGALGITKGSMAATVRSRLHRWSELLWDRAVVNKVSEKTLVLGESFPRPPEDGPRRMGAPSHGAEDRLARGRTHSGLRETREHLTR